MIESRVERVGFDTYLSGIHHVNRQNRTALTAILLLAGWRVSFHAAAQLYFQIFSLLPSRRAHARILTADNMSPGGYSDKQKSRLVSEGGSVADLQVGRMAPDTSKPVCCRPILPRLRDVVKRKCEMAIVTSVSAPPLLAVLVSRSTVDLSSSYHFIGYTDTHVTIWRIRGHQP